MAKNVQTELADLKEHAERAQSYAYRFYGPGDMDPDDMLKGTEDAERIELRVWPDGAYTITSCDLAGRPLGGPLPPPASDEVAYVIGAGQGAFTPRARVVKDEWVQQLDEERAEEEAIDQQVFAHADRGNIEPEQAMEVLKAPDLPTKKQRLRKAILG